MVALGNAVWQAVNTMAYLFVGTYTPGIYVYNLNVTDGSMTLSSFNSKGVGENPSYLSLSQDKKHLYAVNEHANAKTPAGNASGIIQSFQVGKKGELTLLNQQLSGTQSPAHIRVGNMDQYVFVANYNTGVSVFPKNSDGTLGDATYIELGGAGSGVNPSRQDHSYMHSTISSPSGDFVYVADLGADKIMQYRLERTSGKLVKLEPAFVLAGPGSGPRHMAFHPNGQFLFLVAELTNTVYTYQFNEQTGQLTKLFQTSTLPQDFQGWSAIADVHVSKDGRFLYASNRGHNSIARFEINAKTGQATLLGLTPVDGATPRSFIIYKDLLIVANQNSNNIVSFRMNPTTGDLTKLSSVSTPAPVCVKVYKL